jgi:hypothetical protein
VSAAVSRVIEEGTVTIIAGAGATTLRARAGVTAMALPVTGYRSFMPYAIWGGGAANLCPADPQTPGATTST